MKQTLCEAPMICMQDAVSSADGTITTVRFDLLIIAKLISFVVGGVMFQENMKAPARI